MSNEKDDWDVYVKGTGKPYRVTGASNVTVHADVDIIKVVDADGDALALFPQNAVAAVIRIVK